MSGGGTLPVEPLRSESRMKPLLSTLLMLFAVMPAVAGAQTSAAAWPTKPITLIVDSAPGSSNDVFARTLAKHLQDAVGQSVVVDNKPSAGGIIANALVANAAPDGTHLVLLSSTFTTVAATRANLPYDPVKSFTPIARLAGGPMLVAVSASSPYRTLDDLVDAARKEPGKLNYGTSGVGGINHLAAELILTSAGVQMTQVPYKGISLAITDLVGGQVQMIVASAASLLPHVNNGKVRALAVTTAEPSTVVPDLPPIGHSRYRNATSELWWGILAPAGMPPAIVGRLNAEIDRIIRSPDMKSFFLKAGAEPAPLDADAFRAYIVAEIDRWKRVAASAGIQPQ